MAERSGGVGDFEISRAFSRTFQAIGSNPLLFFAVTLVLGAGPGFALHWWQSEQGLGGYPLMLTRIQALGLPFVAIFVLGILANAMLQAALTRATLLSLSGERPGFDRSLEPAIAMVFPLIGMSMLTGLCFMLAALLLIVPGIMLWVTWAVALPAYVEERRGVLKSLDRSAELTKGARWKIFAVMLIAYVAIFALGVAAGVLEQSLLVVTSQPWVPALVTAMVAALGNMVLVTLRASIYAGLREAREGGPTEELEAVFA